MCANSSFAIAHGGGTMRTFPVSISPILSFSNGRKWGSDKNLYRLGYAEPMPAFGLIRTQLNRFRGLNRDFIELLRLLEHWPVSRDCEFLALHTTVGDSSDSSVQP